MNVDGAGISFSHRRTVGANGLILHYVMSLCIDFASGIFSVVSLIRMMKALVFALLEGKWEKHWVQRN